MLRENQSVTDFARESPGDQFLLAAPSRRIASPAPVNRDGNGGRRSRGHDGHHSNDYRRSAGFAQLLVTPTFAVASLHQPEARRAGEDGQTQHDGDLPAQDGK